jgi:hypothetical protein
LKRGSPISSSCQRFSALPVWPADCASVPLPRVAASRGAGSPMRVLSVSPMSRQGSVLWSHKEYRLAQPHKSPPGLRITSTLKQACGAWGLHGERRCGRHLCDRRGKCSQGFRARSRSRSGVFSNTLALVVNQTLSGIRLSRIRANRALTLLPANTYVGGETQ